MATGWRAVARAKPLWWYCYAIAFTFGVAAVIAGHIERHSIIETGLFTVAFALGAIGFLSAIAPALVTLWRSPIGLPLLTFAHVLVGLVDAMHARQLVADALQLPPHDFDLTVAILALLYYIPLWLAFAAVITVVLALLGVVAGLLLHVPIQLLKPVAPSVSAWENLPKRLLLHGAAAMIFATVCGLLAGLFRAPETVLHPFARLIAYAADYFPAAAYPGIPDGQKVRLHENGVVSVARRDRLTVTIEVTTVKLP